MIGVVWCGVVLQVLMSVVQGAVEFPDPVAQKNCFVILRRLTEAWGEKDVGPPGFVEFLYTQVSCESPSPLIRRLRISLHFPLQISSV